MRSASIVVVNHDYGRFLPAAIDSALAQPGAEVVVVDDGSTDESRAVIAAYGDRISAVLKDNGGQASAWAAGLEAARGEAVVFLDADDLLGAGALERALPLLDRPGVVKVHWPLRVVDAEGAWTGELAPDGELPRGDLRPLVLERGPHSYPTPAASGKLWDRGFLARVLPLPVRAQRAHGVDVYLSTVAPLYGAIERVAEPLGAYRIHGANNWAGLSFDERARFDLDAYELHCEALAEHCARLGVPCDPDRWRRDSWLARRLRVAEEIAAVVPPGERFVLIDGAEWGMDETAGRRAVPFVERGGQYWGPPADDPQAVGELARLRGEGIRRVVVGWPAFWWLDQYPAMHRWLREHGGLVCANDRLVVFDLEVAA